MAAVLARYSGIAEYFSLGYFVSILIDLDRQRRSARSVRRLAGFRVAARSSHTDFSRYLLWGCARPSSC
jgi:hypothetical protein